MAGNPPLAGMDDAELVPWRKFFSGVDVFNVIVYAILVAATDMPQEFRRRRDSIVEQIFIASAIVPDLGRATAGEGPSAIAKHGSENGGNDGVATRSCKEDTPPEGGNNVEKEMAAKRPATESNQHDHGHGDGDNDNSGADAEMRLDWLLMLADEMDEATQEIEEILRIKAILVNHHEQSADVLFESLRRLQLMQLTVDKLKSTEIGVAVAALRKHKSHRIRMLVQDIVKGWKVVADEWFAATKVAMAGDSNKSLDKANSSAAEDEGGLAIPPMDVGALFMSQATTIQHVSEFLDGMDDDGGKLNNHITSIDKDGASSARVERKCKYPRPSDTVAVTKPPIILQALPARQGSLFKKRKPEKRCCGIGKSLVLQQRQGLEEGIARQPLQRNPVMLSDETTVHKTQVLLPTRQEAVFLATNLRKPQESSGRRCSSVAIKYNKPSSTEGEPRSLSMGSREKTRHEDLRPRQNRRKVTVTGNPSVVAADRKPPSVHVIKTGTSAKSLEDPKVELGNRHIHLGDMRLEGTKRKLREAYQEAENTKRKRTIQVMEPHEVPKPMAKQTVMKSRHPSGGPPKRSQMTKTANDQT